MMRQPRQQNRQVILKIREALDAYANMTPLEAEALVGRSVSVTIGDTEQTIKIVDANDFLMWMEYHYSWLFTHCSFTPEDIDTAEEKFNAFVLLWDQFYARKEKAIEQWIVDVYTKLDPLVTGWEKVSASKTFENFGYTDTFNKYIATNSLNGRRIELSFDPPTSEDPSAHVGVGDIKEDVLKTTSTSNAATTNETKLAGKISTDASASEAGGVTTGSLGTGATPTTKVWQGTFQSTALTQELPEINEQQNTGETGSRSSSGSQDINWVQGGIMRDSADVGTIDHDQHGVQKDNSNKEANTGDIIERMKEYIKFDVTKAVLDEFYNECTFYVDCYQNDDWGGTLWL